jgi:hypothetical protein
MRAKGGPMTNQNSSEPDEMREDYDLSNIQSNPYAEKMKNGSNLVLIEPEIFKIFPSSEAVNEALRVLIKAAKEAESSIMQKAS